MEVGFFFGGVLGLEEADKGVFFTLNFFELAFYFCFLLFELGKIILFLFCGKVFAKGIYELFL